MNNGFKKEEKSLVAILRGQTRKNIPHIIEHLLKGGFHYIEVTADTPEISEIIQEAKYEFDKNIFIGVGTVLDSETASIAVKSGANFIISPTVNVDTIRLTKRYGAISIPGAMTPSEMLLAYENGADIVKVFPANVLGPEYIKGVQGPLSQIPVMATGGINLDNMEKYYEAGAVSLGIGGSLVESNFDVSAKNLANLTEKARKYVEKLEMIIKDKE